MNEYLVLDSKSTAVVDTFKRKNILFVLTKTASRVKYGKHVVPDQNPLLEHLFTPDGWAWDIALEEVYDLLTLLRKVSFEGNRYTDSGWSKKEINI